MLFRSKWRIQPSCAHIGPSAALKFIRSRHFETSCSQPASHATFSGPGLRSIGPRIWLRVPSVPNPDLLSGCILLTYFLLALQHHMPPKPNIMRMHPRLRSLSSKLLFAVIVFFILLIHHLPSGPNTRNDILRSDFPHPLTAKNIVDEAEGSPKGIRSLLRSTTPALT